jgi:HEAT repeat protein
MKLLLPIYLPILVCFGALAIATQPSLATPLPTERTMDRQVPRETLIRIAELTEKLKSPNSFEQFTAVISLGQMGKSAKSTIPQLQPLLQDPNLRLRGMVANALVRIGASAKIVMPSLVALLKVPDLDPDILTWAAYDVGLLGSSATAAVPDLAALLKNPEERVRGYAAEALGKIGKPALFVLITHLKDPQADVRETTVYGLEVMGSAAKVAIPHVTALLKDPNERVRQRAAIALAEIQSKAPRSTTREAKLNPFDVYEVEVPDRL